MSKLRVDASAEKATPHVERFGTLVAQIAQVQSRRDALIARANVIADRRLQPLLDEAAALKLQLEPWWQRNGAALLNGKRKTVELGGCKIGSKAKKGKLTFAGADDFEAALVALKDCRWAKPYIRTTESVDKVATTTGLEGKHAAGLKELGFAVSGAGDEFVLEPVTQTGTIASTAK